MGESHTQALGKRLRNYRLKQGLTLKEVAQKIGVPTATYREWEYGRAIQGEPYVELAQALQVGLHELLTGREPGAGRVFDKIKSLEGLIQAIKEELRSLF